MFDIRLIREDPDAFDNGLARRGLPPAAADLVELDAKRRAAQTQAQELQTRRNELSKIIGQAKSKGEDAAAEIAEVASSKEAQANAEIEAKEAAAALDDVLAALPNLPDDSVPDGADESANEEIERWGDRRNFDFDPKEHFDIGEALGLMDFERAAKLSGSRFVVLSGALARLERGLGQFMLDIHTQEFGYTEVAPPVLVRDAALFGTGQLPKFGEDQFKTDDGLWMIPTAEVPLTNLVAGEILDEGELPLRYAAYTLCFRSEAGATGKDSRGMIRQHQFNKVELVSITHPDESADEHERLRGCAAEILRRLNIPYRVMVLATGDLGQSARKTYDLEVWLPGQQRYREISSCSNCGDYQARRMNARFRPKEGKGTQFVHTLNGSGLAVGRTLVALLENYQQADGSVALPEAIQPYMGGATAIGPDA